MTELHGPRGTAAGSAGTSSSSAFTGSSEADLTIDAVLDGRVGAGDVGMDPAVLIAQARLAEGDGNAQLGANLRRAAELVGLPDAEVLVIYEALRPSRSSAQELERIAVSLIERGALMNAALIREAAAAYVRRGLVRR